MKELLTGLVFDANGNYRSPSPYDDLPAAIKFIGFIGTHDPAISGACQRWIDEAIPLLHPLLPNQIDENRRSGAVLSRYQTTYTKRGG